MTTEDNFITVYTGYDVNVQHLQNIFEEEGIDCLERNDSESALRGGFGGTTPGQAQLLVLESQEAQALEIIKNTFPEEEGDPEVDEE